MRYIQLLIILLLSNFSNASHTYNLLPRACLTENYLAFNRWSGGNTLKIIYWQEDKINISEVKLTENSDITMAFECTDKTIKVEHVIRKYPSKTFYKSIIDINSLSNPEILSTNRDSSHFKSNSSIKIYGDSFKEATALKNGYSYTLKPEYLGSTNCSPKHNVILEIKNMSSKLTTKEIIATFQKESGCN
jgi:hypothetical protein